MHSAHHSAATTGGEPLSVLVGIPDAAERARVSALLRSEGYRVLEAQDTREMQRRLDELAQGGASPDASVCAGLLAEKDDPALAARLASPEVARAVILLPSDGLLATATRAQRLAASAVLPSVSALHRLRELLGSPRSA
jgi:CheY-like chemotaxis protein